MGKRWYWVPDMEGPCQEPPGRGAGLTDRLMGCGGIECMISGVIAARAIIREIIKWN